jgi:hypothetical protein
VQPCSARVGLGAGVLMGWMGGGIGSGRGGGSVNQAAALACVGVNRLCGCERPAGLPDRGSWAVDSGPGFAPAGPVPAQSIYLLPVLGTAATFDAQGKENSMEHC